MNKQNRKKTKWTALALLSIIPALTFAQDDAGGDQGGGGDSAAEAAVTSGSVSKPATAESGSIEGNPIVNYVRADPTGASFSLLQNLDINELRQSARETGGDLTKLKENVSHVKLGKKLTEVITARKLGVNLSDTKKDLTTILKQVASGITVANINAMDSSELATTAKLIAAGLSAETINKMDTLGLATALEFVEENPNNDFTDYVVDNSGFSNKLVKLGFTESNINGKSGLEKLYNLASDSASATPVPLEPAAITAIDNLLTAGITITKYLDLRTATFTTANIQTLLDNGFTAAYLEVESDLTTLLALTFTAELSADELGVMATLTSSNYTLANIKVLIAAEFTFPDLSGKSAGELAYILSNLSSTIADKDKFLTKATASTWTFNSISNEDFESIIDDATWFSDFSTKLESAGKIADLILTPKDETNVNDLVINVGTLAADGYTTELIRILGKYGAIGSAEDGNALSDSLANSVLGQNYESQKLSDIVNLKSSSTDWLADLANLGAGTFHDEDKDSTVLDVKLSNVTLSTGSDIAFSNGATVDVSDILEPATNGRKVHVIGAAKDLTIKGDVTFTNTKNTAEDHALAIGAADDVYFRSEYSNANSVDYNDPDPITVKYTGSNLGIGSNDTMRLVNVNMEAGGNLALASLDELHISTSDARENSTFTVGNGGNSPDNVYLYANELIQINGLNFSGNLDDVYMEAIIINLKNVVFPANAEVMLRAGDGSLHFENYNSASRGVNLTNVVHQGIRGAALQQSDFEGSDGHINSVKTFENNTPKIRIRGQ